MTTTFQSEICCGNCGATNEHTVLGSTNTYGSSDLDLRPPMMQRSTIALWVQMCPICRFCASDISDPPADPEVLQSEAYQEALAREDVPELARRFLASAVALGESDRLASAQALLNAAWVCDDSKLNDQAVKCRKRAAEALRRGMPDADEEERRQALGAVTVDVLRRSGEFAQASTVCSALLAQPEVTGVLRSVLKLQERLISAADTEAHLVSEARESDENA